VSLSKIRMYSTVKSIYYFSCFHPDYPTSASDVSRLSRILRHSQIHATTRCKLREKLKKDENSPCRNLRLGYILGAHGSVVVEALYHKPEGHGFESR
jgi:hypothetical protein